MQQKRGKNLSKSNKKPRSANWRVVIPNLQQYQTASQQQLLQLKYQVLQRIKAKQTKHKLRYYRIALQHHQNSIPHLDILLIYEASKQRRLTDFDYILRHGNVTTYRKLNDAILSYGTKEDKYNLSNLPPDTSAVLQLQQFKSDPYLFLYNQMKKDPLHFNVEAYVQKNQLSQHISNWGSIKSKLKDMQLAAANILLRQKPGLKLITKQLIRKRFTKGEHKTYKKFKELYNLIIERINHIILHPNNSPQTTNELQSKHLFINSKQSSIGKTSLVDFKVLANSKFAHPGLSHYLPVYYLNSTQTYFPPYTSYVYAAVFWDQFTIDSITFPKKRYNLLLSYLGGSTVSLPIKGHHAALRRDNPLHILTSNYTLQELICKTFKSEDSRAKARSNLSARIQQVTVPKGVSLHLLRKLFVSE